MNISKNCNKQTDSLLTERYMRVLLRERVEELGSQKAVAQEIGISETYMSDVLNGVRHVSRVVAQYLGYELMTVYKRLPTLEDYPVLRATTVKEFDERYGR